MTDAAVPAPTPKRRRWIWAFLIVSLAINALLVGVIARGLWSARANVMMSGGGIEAALPAFVDTLPTQRRDELRRSSLTQRPGALRPLRVEVRRARMEAYRAFIADPFDKSAFVAAQSRLFEAEGNLRMTVQRMLPEIGERLTAQERRAYLNWRGGGWGGGSFRRGMGRGEGDEPGSGPGPRRP